MSPSGNRISDGKLNKVYYVKMVNMDSLHSIAYEVMLQIETICHFVYYVACHMSNESQVNNRRYFHDSETAFS